jgi:hypothetical protein
MHLHLDYPNSPAPLRECFAKLSLNDVVRNNNSKQVEIYCSKIAAIINMGKRFFLIAMPQK